MDEKQTDQLMFTEVPRKAREASVERFKTLDAEITEIGTIAKALYGDLKKKKSTDTVVSVSKENLVAAIRLLEKARKDKHNSKSDYFLLQLLKVAANTFRESPARFEKKAAAFLKILKITDKKRPRLGVSQSVLYEGYLYLTDVFNFEPWAALEDICEKRKLTSPEAVLKQIRLFVCEQKKALEAEGVDTDFLKNFLPGNPA